MGWEEGEENEDVAPLSTSSGARFSGEDATSVDVTRALTGTEVEVDIGGRGEEGEGRGVAVTRWAGRGRGGRGDAAREDERRGRVMHRRR